MIEKPYFAILNSPDGGVMPFMENEYELAMFKTELDAKEAVFKNRLGGTFGFEIFELGGGVYSA